MSPPRRGVRTGISVITPTLDRPDEVRALLHNLAAQTVPPLELVLVDGAPPEMRDTERVVTDLRESMPYRVTYIRRGGGTAIQRNLGIDAAEGAFVAFVDDDMLLESEFFEVALAELARPQATDVVAIAGYITNQFLNPATSPRWRLFRRLRLFSTYEPGKYDFATGYPINRYLQPPHDGLREIDFMGTNCAVWRREPFDQGLRLSSFFIDYGMVEDAHLALQARRAGWRILECGRARCVHNHSPRGRPNKRRVARKTAVNYRFLFVDTVPDRTLRQEVRFWRVQAVELLRFAAAAVRNGGDNWSALLGKAEGILAATRVHPGATTPP
jgi:glycosyltransferase involved in cell wall biosynthesis